MSIGARSQSAKTYLEKHYESFADCMIFCDLHSWVEKLIKYLRLARRPCTSWTPCFTRDAPARQGTQCEQHFNWSNWPQKRVRGERGAGRVIPYPWEPVSRAIPPNHDCKGDSSGGSRQCTCCRSSSACSRRRRRDHGRIKIRTCTTCYRWHFVALCIILLKLEYYMRYAMSGGCGRWVLNTVRYKKLYFSL